MKNKRLTLFLVSALGGIALINASSALAADSDKFSLGTGFDYSSGKYGTTSTTDILTVPLIGLYQASSWSFKLTVPYVSLTGTGEVGLGGRQVKSTSTTTKRTTQSGLGDVLAAATYNVYAGGENRFAVDVTGRIKFGTASTKLGTGENDYAAQIALYKGFDRFTSMVALGYEVLGSSTGLDLNNVTYGTLGGDYKFTNLTNGGLEMYVSEKASALEEAHRELTVYVSHRIDQNYQIRGYVLKGFSDGSPDNGFGALFSSSF